MIGPGRKEPNADEPSPEAFARRTRELGLDLAPDDVAELHRGWIGLQPFLVRIRAGLAPLQRLDGTDPSRGPRSDVPDRA